MYAFCSEHMIYEAYQFDRLLHKEDDAVEHVLEVCGRPNTHQPVLDAWYKGPQMWKSRRQVDLQQELRFAVNDDH